MKTTKSIFYVLLALLCVSVTSCDKEDENDDENLIVGKWDFTRIKSTDYKNGTVERTQDLTLAQLSEDEEVGITNLRFEFEQGSKGSISVTGKFDDDDTRTMTFTQNFTYRVQAGSVVITLPNSDDDDEIDFEDFVGSGTMEIVTLTSTNLTVKSDETEQWQGDTYRYVQELYFQRAN